MIRFKVTIKRTDGTKSFENLQMDHSIETLFKTGVKSITITYVDGSSQLWEVYENRFRMPIRKGYGDI